MSATVTLDKVNEVEKVTYVLVPLTGANVGDSDGAAVLGTPVGFCVDGVAVLGTPVGFAVVGFAVVGAAEGEA